VTERAPSSVPATETYHEAIPEAGLAGVALHPLADLAGQPLALAEVRLDLLPMPEVVGEDGIDVVEPQDGE
jgi:hypothetical protein